MYKVGDFIRYISGKKKITTRVVIADQIPNYVGIMSGENVHVDDCELWQPRENELCCFTKKGSEVICVAHFEAGDIYNINSIIKSTELGDDGNNYWETCTPLMSLQAKMLRESEG